MELETDWIKNFEESERNYNIFYKSEVKKVKLYSIYVNPQCVIEKIKQQPINLNTNILSKHELARLIKDQKNDENISYKLISLLSYNNTLEPENIKECIYKQIDQDFLTIHKNLTDIKFDNCIEMFQDLSCLFFIFYELPRKLKNNNTKKIYLHSSSHRKTKRNRLKDN